MLTRFLFCLLFVLPLAACEDSSDKQLASAQSCLNTATASNVDTCLIPIAGQTTAASYAIRCSADFIAQGFDTTRLTAAFANANSTTSNNGPILTAVATMTFWDSLPAGHTSDNALSNCTLSGDDSYRRLAEFSKFATTMSPNTGISAQTNTVATGIIEGRENATVETSIGAQTQTLYQDFCVEKSPFSGSDICTVLAEYINLGSDLLIGTSIMRYTAGQITF